MRISIRLAEPLGPLFSSAFDEFTVTTETVLVGDLPDRSALHGVLARLRDLDLAVIDLHVDAGGPAETESRPPSTSVQ